jgi:hypothetical protein
MPGTQDPFQETAIRIEAALAESLDVHKLKARVEALTWENSHLRKELQQWESGLRSPPWTHLVAVEDGMGR